jgi:predicted dehydrogenase
MTTIALVGITHPHASGRLRALLRRPDVKVVAAADDAPVTEAFVRHFSLARRGIDDIMDDPVIDAVLVHAASTMMTSLSVRALRAGKSVLVEKPGGRNVADLQQLAAAARAAAGVLQLGYSTRASQGLARASQILASGVLGTVIQARVHMGCALGEAASHHINNPAEMGGALWVIGCHAVDLIVSLFGTPASVNARVLRLGGAIAPNCREDGAGVVLSYPGFLVTLDFTSWEPMPWIEGHEIAVHGTNGVLRAGILPAQTHLFVQSEGGAYPRGWSHWQATTFPQPWAATVTDYSPELAEIANEEFFDHEIDTFLAAHRGECEVLASAEEALTTARVIAACYASDERGGAEVAVG